MQHNQKDAIKELIMASTMKSNAEAQEQSPRPEARGPATPVTDMFRSGVERLAGAHKKALDIAAQQNKATFKAVKEGLRMAGATPAVAFAECAEEVAAEFDEAQKTIVDLAVEQAEIAVKTGEVSAAKLGIGFADLLRPGLDAIAASQQTWIELARTQQRLAADSAKRQMGTLGGPPAAAFAETFQKGMESYLELQKNLMDMAAEQGAAWFRVAREGKMPGPASDVADFARKGMDAIADTQRRLFAIASEGAAKVARAAAE
jgi:hypothetical protein